MEKELNYPKPEELANAFARYKLIVKAFSSILDKLEESNKNEQRWFVFTEKIGKKFLAQAYTLEHIFAYDTYFEKKGESVRFIDFSSINSLLRVQLETYTVFYHLFAEKCDMGERIIRFRLWELDGLRIRHKFIPPGSEQFLENEKSIDNCIDVIRKLAYFRNLDIKTQDFLVKYAAWKFTDSSLKNSDNNKKRISIEQMIMRTGLDPKMFNDWYSFTSMHSHTSYWSVIQNDTLTLGEKITAEYVALMEANYISSFFIKDLCRLFDVTKTAFDQLPINDQEIINSFNDSGRKQL